MKQFSAICIFNGGIRKITFEAINEDEAQRLTSSWGCGLEGETTARAIDRVASTVPDVYDEETARKLLGNISRTTLYRLLIRKKLDRVSSTRKILVTRRSIERFCCQRDEQIQN